MSEWREVTLGELVAESRGSIKTGPFGTTLKAAEYSSAGVPVVSVGEIGDGALRIKESTPRVGTVVTERLPEYLLRTGDIVLGRKGAVDRSATVRHAEDGYFQGSDALRIRFGSAVDWRFVAYQMRTRTSREWLVRHASGSTLLSMNQATLARLPISIPELAEQQAIAGVLGALDDKIEANRKLAATADALADALVQQAARDSWARLDEVAVITMGTSPKGEFLNEEGEGLPFFQGIRDFGLRYPSRRVYATSTPRVADSGDVLLSVRAPVGTLNLAPEPLCIGRGVAALRPLDGRPYLLFHLLRAIPEVWSRYNADGTVFGSINRKQLAGLEVPALAESSATAIETELQSVERRLEIAIREADTLATLRDALLPKLMSGQLRVEDAAALV